ARARSGRAVRSRKRGHRGRALRAHRIALVRRARGLPQPVLRVHLGRRDARSAPSASPASRGRAAMTPPAWTDWLTGSFFRIRIAPAAAEKLGQLRAETQLRLRQMLQDIAELADLVPPSTGRAWNASDGSSLLQLQLGRINVRYS